MNARDLFTIAMVAGAAAFVLLVFDHRWRDSNPGLTKGVLGSGGYGRPSLRSQSLSCRSSYLRVDKHQEQPLHRSRLEAAGVRRNVAVSINRATLEPWLRRLDKRQSLTPFLLQRR